MCDFSPIMKCSQVPHKYEHRNVHAISWSDSFQLLYITHVAHKNDFKGDGKCLEAWKRNLIILTNFNSKPKKFCIIPEMFQRPDS